MRTSTCVTQYRETKKGKGRAGVVVRRKVHEPRTNRKLACERARRYARSAGVGENLYYPVTETLLMQCRSKNYSQDQCLKISSLRGLKIFRRKFF